MASSSAKLRLEAVLRHLHSEEPHIAQEDVLSSNDGCHGLQSGLEAGLPLFPSELQPLESSLPLGDPATRAAVTSHVTSLHVSSCSTSFFQVQLQPPCSKDSVKGPVDPVHARRAPASHCSISTSSTPAPTAQEISHPPASRKDNRVSFGRACRDDDVLPSASSSWPPVLAEAPLSHTPHPRCDSRTLFARVSSGIPDVSCLPQGMKSLPAASRTIALPTANKFLQQHKAPLARSPVACSPCSGPGVWTTCSACGLPVKGPTTCGLPGCNLCGAVKCGAPPPLESKGECGCPQPAGVHERRMAECFHCHATVPVSTTGDPGGKQCELQTGAALSNRSMPASPSALLSQPPTAPAPEAATRAVTTHHPEAAVPCPTLVFPQPPPPAIALESGQGLVLVIPLPADVGAKDFSVQIEKRSIVHVLIQEQGMHKTLFRWALPVTCLAVDKASAELREKVIHITFPNLASI